MKSVLRALSLVLLALFASSASAQQQTGPYIQVSPTPSKLSVGGPGFVQIDANGIASIAPAAPGTGTVTATSGALALDHMVVGNGGDDIKTIGGTIGGAFTTAGPFTTTGAATGVILAFPTGGPFTFTLPAASQTLASLAGSETFTNKIYSSGQLSGTFTGNPTFSGIPLFTNLLSGTQTVCLGLDSTFHLVTSAGACGSGSSGISGLTAGQVPLAGSATTLTSSFPLGTGTQTALSVNVGTAGAFAKNNGDALSGTYTGTPTFSGNLIFSGVPKFTGLSTGTIASGKNLGLDSSNNLVVNTVSGGGTGCTVAGGSGDVQKNDGAGACAAAKINENGTQTTINYNTGALTASPTGTTLQVGQADTTVNRITLDAFGAAGSLAGRRAAGTNASKTATVADTIVLSLDSFTYDGTNYSANSRAKVSLVSAETQSATAQGSYIDLSTTLKTTTTTAAKLRINDDGGITIASDVVGAGPTGGTKGAGTVNISGNYYINGIGVNAGQTLVADANCAALTNATKSIAFNTVLTAARSCTLPDPSTMLAGQPIEFIDGGNGTNPAINGANTVTINAFAGTKIDGATSILMGIGYCAVRLKAVDAANYSVAVNSCATVPVAQGGTGATTASGARTNLGVGTTATTTNALVGDGAGNAAAAAGTGTNCLLVNGSNSACGAGAGIGTKIATCTSASTTCNFSSLGSHDYYTMVCSGLDTTHGVFVTVNSDTTAAHYKWVFVQNNASATAPTGVSSTSAANIQIYSDAAFAPVDFSMNFGNIASTSYVKLFRIAASTVFSGDVYNDQGAGEFTQSGTAVTSVQVLPASGNFNAGSGKCTLYAYDS